MKRKLATLVISLSLALGATTGAWAQDFQKGARAYRSGNYATALNEWRPLAEQGDVRAQYILGFMYENGQGVAESWQHYKEALKWYRLAAEQGRVEAQYNLGVMYGKGRGVTQDDVTAHVLFSIVASKGYADAVTNRDIIARRMNTVQIAGAKQLARDCLAKNFNALCAARLRGLWRR